MRNPVRSTRIRNWLAIGIAWAGVAHLLAAGSPHEGGIVSSETSELLPGIDYVQGEVLITFRSADMPSRDEVATAPARVSIEPLDEFFESVGAADLRKLFPWDESYESEAGQRLARTFVLRYDAPVDAQELVEQLRELPYFERVAPNRILHLEPQGTREVVPGDTTLFSDQWYFDNTDTGDSSDIDMPEAWAIEPGGDSNLVVGIFDEGTMVDTTVSPDPGPWRFHSDFRLHWITAEDVGSPGAINGADLDGVDSNNDMPNNPTNHESYAYAANITGFHLLEGFDADTSSGSEYRKRFWYGVPHSWLLDLNCGSKPCPNSWDVVDVTRHGVWVGSIAAAKLDGSKPDTDPAGKDIVGAAYNCKVYNVRFDSHQRSDEMVNAIKHLAQVCRVVNMSFGTTVPDEYVRDATVVATHDRDCVLVAAIGNDPGSTLCPARYDSVMAVGGIRRSPLKLWWDSANSGSGYSPNQRIVDVVAPMQDSDGLSITADGFSTCPAYPCSPDERAEKIPELGTSFAAPQVAGVAALVRSRFPGLNQFQVKQRIKNGAEYYWTDDETNRRKYGYGKVNAYRALTEWGNISTGVEWSAAADGSALYSRDGILYISGDLTIKNGGTLTINPGVLARVAPDHLQTGDTSRVEIVVESGGRLDILGTASDPVRFESFTDSAPSDTDWVGITFQSGSHGILEHVVIDNAIQDVEVAGYSISVADWDESKTLYLDSTLPVTDDLTIGSAETLYVLGESPVAVTGGSSIGIDVNGTLVCGGTTNDKPEFTATTAVPDAWDGIAFGDSSENNVLEHFIVRHAVTALKSQVPLSIEDVTLSDGSEGIEAHADIEVTTGNISDFTAYGVEVLKGHTTLSDVTITDCGMGIALGGYEQSASDSTSVSATGCTIASPDFHGVTTSTYDHRHLALDETEITDAYYGVSLINGNTADIRDCTLRRNDSGLLLLADPKAIAVRSSAIDTSTTSGVYCVNGGTNYYLGGNTIQANPVGVLCLNASPLIKNGNSITANTTGIKCDSGSSPVIEWNTISANTTGVWTLDGSNPDLGHATGGSSIGNNTFTGNTSYHVRHQTVSTTLMAENDWWGSSSGPDPGKISGSVDYDPWLTSAPASPPSPAPPAGEDREEELATEIPDRFDLSPGYPNPFNPSVTLRVQVPRPGSRVTVVLYNVRGEAVRTLLDEYRAPGTHVLTWNGRTETGEAAATGVYFVRMRSPGYVETRKIVLIK